MVNDLITFVLRDYDVHARKSKRTAVVHGGHLLERDQLFDNRRADTVTGADVATYVLYRKELGFAPATINRELAMLRRGYSLAELKAPRIVRLKENNVRTGFVEYDEFERVKALLPSHYARPYQFAFFVGWRVSEILTLPRSAVDIQGHVIRIDGKHTKNGRGRVVALYGECLEAVLSAHQDSEAKGSQWLFAGENGKQMPRGTFYFNVKKAFCTAGYPSRIFHDLRRTAARNLLRAGNHEKLAMATTGHVTRSVFDRYDIVDEKDAMAAAEKVQHYIDEVKKTINQQRVALDLINFSSAVSGHVSSTTRALLK